MPKLSVVIPVYYNELNLKPLYEELKEKFINVIDFEYEIVMVDDGSGDNSWGVMKEIAELDSYAASLCGLTKCTGDCVILKAADLQEPTEMILEMYQRWKDGNNVVLAVRADRDEPLNQKVFANIYYKLTQKFVLNNMPNGGFDTFLVDRQVIETLIKYNEKDSALPGLILWSGYKTAIVPYVRRARTIGKSRWTLRKKIKLVMDTLYGFSSVPISLVTGIGTITVIGAAVWAMVVLIGKFMGKINVSGWTTLFILNLFSFGTIMITLGILGGYLWRTFNATRNRPVYIEEEFKERQ